MAVVEFTMATAGLICEPELLSALPRPFDADQGRPWVGSSNVLSRGQKRKRAEIAIGTDGQSLNCYAIKTSRLVSSHAVSPHSTFTAPPSFALLKPTRKYPAQRYAYAAVRDSLSHGKNNQLLCFHETLKQVSAVDSTDFYRKSRADLGTSQDPVVFVETASAISGAQSGGPSFDIVAVQKSGAVSCFSTNLDIKRWTAITSDPARSFESSAFSAPEVKWCRIFNAATLADGFLQSHPDILAQMQPAVDDEGETLKRTQVMCTIRELPGTNASSFVHRLQCHLLHAPNATTGRDHSLRCVADWLLPTSQTRKDCKFELDVGTGLLQQISTHAVSFVDLARTVPIELWHRCDESSENTGVAHLGGPLVMLSTRAHCSIYNVRYQTLLDRRHTSLTSLGDHIRKRKRHADSPQSPIRIIQYFAESRRAIGLSDTHVVSMPVGISEQNKSNKRQKIGLLAKSLGKKPPTNDAQLRKSAFGETNAKNAALEAKKLDDYKASIDKAFTSNNVNEFDSKFLESIVDDTTLSAVAKSSRSLYALGKIFGWHQKQRGFKQPTRHALHMRCKPPATFRWLATRALITPANVEKSLQQSTGPSCPLPSVSARELIASIAQYDPSLLCLSEWLELHPHTDAQAVVHALNFLLHSFDAPIVLGEARMITDGRGEVDEEMQDEVNAEEDAAQHDLEVASTFLEDGLQARARAIRSCLDTLTTCFPPAIITASLMHGLERPQLLLLIDLLRFDLIEGGWGSNIMDFYPTTEPIETSRDSISPLCTLLNCAVDSLGGGGWLAGAYGSETDHDRVSDFVARLRNETSAVLAGVQESTFFSGFLKDFLRFERTLTDARRSSQSTSHELRRPGAKLGALRSDAAKLPMGRKTAESTSTTRIMDGGAVGTRSKRDMHEEKSRQLDVYSFNTIRI